MWCLQLFAVDNCIDDWRIAMSAQRSVQLSIELAVCSIHPLPGAFYFTWTPVESRHGPVSTETVPVDLVRGSLMLRGSPWTCCCPCRCFYVCTSSVVSCCFIVASSRTPHLVASVLSIVSASTPALYSRPS